MVPSGIEYQDFGEVRSAPPRASEAQVQPAMVCLGTQRLRPVPSESVFPRETKPAYPEALSNKSAAWVR